MLAVSKFICRGCACCFHTGRIGSTCIARNSGKVTPLLLLRTVGARSVLQPTAGILPTPAHSGGKKSSRIRIAGMRVIRTEETEGMEGKERTENRSHRK